MSYLDDPDHVWEVDPSVKADPRTMTGLFMELTTRSVSEGDEFSPAWEMIILGAAELKKRHPEATVAECLDTSMIWYYG